MTGMTSPISIAVIWYTSLLFGVLATEATISAAAEGQSCSSSGGECLADATVGMKAMDVQVDEGTQPTAFVQTRAKAKYLGQGARQILVGHGADEASELSEDEGHESGDGDADKELILEDFRSNLSDCMYQMADNIDDGNRTEELDLIYQAEVLRKAHSLGLVTEENIVWAAVLAARTGAQRIARKQARNALLETFAKQNITSEIRDKFVSHLASMAHLCNDSADADALVADEKFLLSTDGGPLKAAEAQAGMELAEYVISKCAEDALDLEWFFAHAASLSNADSCGTLVDQEIKQNLGDEAVVHDAHIQTVLALHNEENQLGHDYAKHLKHVTDGIITHSEFAHTGADQLRNALLSDLSKATRAKLRHLENKNFAKVNGATKRELCAQRDELKADDPDHYSLQKDTVYTKMYKCMCEDDEIALVCQALYHEDIAEEQPHYFKRIQQATQEEKEARNRKTIASVARANASWVDPSGGGLCKVPIQGCVSISGRLAGVSGAVTKCCLPARADANMWGWHHCGNPFGFFALIGDPAAQIEASIEFHYGWPAVECAFKLRIRIGIGTTAANGHWSDVMVNFNIFLAIDLCLGGTIGSIATALGWAACQNIGTIRYYPFIGKLTGSLRLPVFQAWVVSAWARLDIGGPVHDVTEAIKDVIRNPDANAFRAACPGCPGTSAAAALVSYDESSDDSANIDDAANLGFWRRRRRRRRDRRRRDRRRNICIIRPCNGGSAREYWKRKMEDARGGLQLKITGEGCALWWCKDIVNFEWKWGTPSISV